MPIGAPRRPLPLRVRRVHGRAGMRLRAPMRIQRRFQFLERRGVRTAILARHARSAVPSSAGSARTRSHGPSVSYPAGQPNLSPNLLAAQGFRTKS